MNSCPIVTVNLWFNRRIIDEPFIGLPGRAMQWVFDKRLVFGDEASHLSLVSSGADSVVARTNDELIQLAHAGAATRRCRTSAPPDSCARPSSVNRARRSRSHPVSRRGRRPKPASAVSIWPATGSTPGCRRRLSPPSDAGHRAADLSLGDWVIW